MAGMDYIIPKHRATVPERRGFGSNAGAWMMGEASGPNLIQYVCGYMCLCWFFRLEATGDHTERPTVRNGVLVFENRTVV